MNRKYIKFTIYFVIIVLLNFVSDSLFLRVDLTKNQMFSISDASKDLVKNLSVPLTIKVFFTSDLPAPHNNTERYLRDLLEEYSSQGNRNFNYQFLNVSAKKEQTLSSIGNQSIAESYDIKPSGIRIIEEDEESIKYAYRGLVLINGDMIERIPVIESTEGLEYKITMAIRRLNNKISVLSSIDGKIDVKLYMSDSLIKIAPFLQVPDISKAPATIKDAIEKLNRTYFNKINFKYINPSKSSSPNLAAEIKKNGIFSISWEAIPQKGIEKGTGSMGMLISYKDKKITIPVLESVRIPLFDVTQYKYNLKQTIEFLPDYLEAVIDIDQKIGFLSSHSGHTLQQTRAGQKKSFDVFNSLLSNNYTVKEVDITKNRINENLKCLIIADPVKKFSDYELYQIDQALMRGTNLAFFMDPFKQTQVTRQMQMMGKRSNFVPVDTGLGKLLEHYGVTVKKSYVMDENCYKPVDPRQGMVKLYYIPIIQSENINTDLPFMKDLKGLVTMQAAPLAVSEAKRKDPKVKVFSLFTTSKKSWEVKKNFNLDNPKAIVIPESAKTKGRKDLAFILEGEFESYFKGKEIPVKKRSKADTKKIKNQNLKSIKTESKKEFIAKRSNGKIFVMGTSKMLENNLIDQEGQSPNSIFVMNVIDSLNDLESIAVMRGKKKGFNPISKTDYLTKSFFKGINIVGLPIMIVIFGGVVWLKRSGRKRAIKKEFSKDI
jgi:ABC-type uncharacterized transport system involved in gliding motility auxiliary subunit